jgi:hypothetical protein
MRWLFHFAEFPVNKQPLLEARQGCRDISLQPQIAATENALRWRLQAAVKDRF